MSDSPIPPDASVIRFAALHLLCALGWQYLPPEACQQKRGGGQRMLLQSSLLEALGRRQFLYNGESHYLSPSAIEQVVRELTIEWQADNWLHLNKTCYETLCAGVTVTEFLPGDVRHNVTVPIIDWQQKKGNVFQVSEQVMVLTKDGITSREIDLVCYVNGIPLCLILVQTDVERGIAQHLRNQQAGEIPHLYGYAQLLMVLGQNTCVYGSNHTKEKFWTHWREEELSREHAMQLKQTTLEIGHGMFAGLSPALKATLKAVQTKWRTEPINETDQMLIGMLGTTRLLEFLPNYVLFDAKGGKLLARSHQFFAVRVLIQRLANYKTGERSGGVIWHTTGSGKSLTMVLLINLLRRHPILQDCRIVVVTDRLDLENQLLNKFAHSGSFGEAWRKTGMEKVKAHSAHDLARRIGRNNDQIIFTLLHKFNDALLHEDCHNPSDKVIVLIDEAHRSQGGELHQRMRRVLKRAALVAFTGTPLLKYEKTISQFGPILHRYTMQRALQDKMVVPLLYEERIPELVINDTALKNWQRENAAGLDPSQQSSLYATICQKSQLYRVGERIEMIAWDIARHFDSTIKQVGLGLKGLVATASKQDAIAYKHYLDQTGLVTSAVIISAPDAADTVVFSWWQKNILTCAGDYEKSTLARFAKAGDLDLLIVVDRLLTGFDQARAAVLYIDKPLQQHGLIQAIARVNRLHDEKTYGILIDYRGILRPLDTALRAYRELEQAQAYDAEDLLDIYHVFENEYRSLPQLLEALEADFLSQDLAAGRQSLHPQYVPNEAQVQSGMQAYWQAELIDLRYQRRKVFLNRLREYSQCLRLALSSRHFFNDPNFSESDLQHYKDRLQFFTELAHLARRDAEPMLNHRGTYAVKPNVLNGIVQGLQVRQDKNQYQVWTADEFDAGFTPLPEYNEVRHWSDEKVRSHADLICSRITHSIAVELDDDPYAQQMLGTLLQRSLAKLNAKFISPLEHYSALTEIQQRVVHRQVEGLPPGLQGQADASVWYGIFMLALSPDDVAAATPEAKLTWEQQALAMAVWIRKGELENSLNHSGLENMICNRLLRELFPLFLLPKLLTLQQVLALVEQVLQVVRIHMRNQAY